ncbi:MAG TPA: hypothetical protein VN951_15580 [Pyrinomonadaceae bacterium]|nr:hypothetical protein [Pyrinomonadaceae bacterium]
MKLDSLIAVAILVVAVLGCVNNNQNNRTDSPPNVQSSPVEGRGEGPVSQAPGAEGSYGPNRDPTENADNYRLQQQGQVGPCNEKYNEFYNAYFQWKNNTIPVERFREYENAYDACVNYYYRSR